MPNISRCWVTAAPNPTYELSQRESSPSLPSPRCAGEGGREQFLLLVQPAKEVVLHGAAAHGAFAVADDDDDVVASAFGAQVAGEAAHVVDGAGFADDPPGECFAAVAFAQGTAFAGHRQ